MKEENSKERERLSFEEALNELDEIVQQLEKDDVSLNRSIELYEEGLSSQKNVQIYLRKRS